MWLRLRMISARNVPSAPMLAIARGLASRDEAKRTDRYFTVEESLSGLDAILAKHKPDAR